MGCAAAGGAWDWLDFGLEPHEAPDAAFQGATMAAVAAGSPAGRQASENEAARAGVERLRGYLRSHVTGQRAFNRAWLLVAVTRLDGLLTGKERDAIVTDLKSLQRPDGGWSLTDLGVSRWTRREAPFAPPGEVDRALLAQSDGYATGLVVYREHGGPKGEPYALRRSGRPLSSLAVPQLVELATNILEEVAAEGACCKMCQPAHALLTGAASWASVTPHCRSCRAGPLRP